MGTGRRHVGNAQLLPDDVGLAFAAGDALADSDDEPAKFRNHVAEAVEAFVVAAETLIDGFKLLDDGPVLSVETPVNQFDQLVVGPFLSVEAVAVDGDEAGEGRHDDGKDDKGVTVFFRSSLA